ncbi:hypothetical protein, partial [Burkholderia glumae]|uniref:hypothetical protein n=1 Tax=Burkholderia glumae TaxID=337 RepID=UPI001E2A2BFD
MLRRIDRLRLHRSAEPRVCGMALFVRVVTNEHLYGMHHFFLESGSSPVVRSSMISPDFFDRYPRSGPGSR